MHRAAWTLILLLVARIPVIAAPVASYTVEARLDLGRKTLVGHETVTWRNATAHPTAELYWHLYLNAFRNARSTYFKETGGAGPLLRRERFGSIDIDSMFLLLANGAKVDLKRALGFVSPDDGNPEDGTVAHLALPAPVPPGGEIRIRVGFTSRLPASFDRTGFNGEELFVAQWFPKLGVLEDNGWNCHQAHAWTEYYADFGTYDVQLRLPANLVMGATGELQSVTDHRDGSVTYRFHQDDVHDFAWTASPDFKVLHDRFEHPGFPPVDINLLLQPEHRAQAERYLVAVKHALRFFGEWYGSYPYPTLTVVDPVRGSRADRMEYPTLVAAGTDWLAPEGGAEPEATLLHEIAHQFWYGLVANDEVEHAWLDEGFATYSSARLMDLAYGKRRLTKKYFGLPVAIRRSEAPALAPSVAAYRRDGRLDIMDRPAWLYASPRAYQVSAYDKPALMLETLHRHFGDDVWGRAMRAYQERWRFRHPKPRDFIAVVAEATGQDLTAFFDRVIWGTDLLDYGVGEVESRPMHPGGERRYRSSVMVRRLGEVRFPVEVLIQFADGVELTESWDGESPWHRFTFVSGAPVERVLVDPKHKLKLDVARSNNSRVVNPSRLFARGARGGSGRWVFWLQMLLEVFAFFG